MGVNAIAKTPKIIATFLKLPNADQYTGHCFRRTAATITAEAGIGDIAMCHLAGWKNLQTAKRYVDNTHKMKHNTANLIATTVNLPSTSNAVAEKPKSKSKKRSSASLKDDSIPEVSVKKSKNGLEPYTEKWYDSMANHPDMIFSQEEVEEIFRPESPAMSEFESDLSQDNNKNDDNNHIIQEEPDDVLNRDGPPVTQEITQRNQLNKSEVLNNQKTIFNCNKCVFNIYYK